MIEKVVVSRHSAMLEYLIEENWVEPGTKFVSKAYPGDVDGKHVFGVLPMWLAGQAHMLTEVIVNTPWEWGGNRKELSVDQIRTYARDPVTYRIEPVPYDRPEPFEGEDIPWEE